MSATRGIDIVRSLAEQRLSNGNATARFMDVCTIEVQSNELCRAVALGAVRLVRTLLHGGFDVTATNDDRQTALHIFAIRRDLHSDEDALILRLLFEYGVNANATDRWGKTALIYATGLRKSNKFIAALLEAPVDIFVEDHIGFSALTYAYNAHRESTIKLLVDKCNEEGREMVVLETRMNANFLSYLKIQKLVGAESSSVRLEKSSNQGVKPTSLASSSTPSTARRLSQSIGPLKSNL